MIKLWSKLNDLVNSSYNFLFDKLFHRRRNCLTHGSNGANNCYGKRLKLSDEYWDCDDFLKSAPSSRLFSMQKENIVSDDDDDDDECCVIAEIPRRKKAGSSSNVDNTPKPVPSKVGSSKSKAIITFTFKKDTDTNEIETVKVVGSNSGKNVLNRPHNKNKFFHNQRVLPSPGKITKCKSFKQHLRRKMNFLQESYRLTEKLQYLQLLQSQTSCNLITVKPTLKKITYEVKPIPIIDLTDETPDDWSDKLESELECTSSEDQDVQIIKEIPRIRSLQDVLKIQSLNSDEANKQVVSRNFDNFKFLDLNGKPVDTISLLDDDNKTSHQSDTDALEERLRNYMQITGPAVQEVDTTLEEQYFLPELTCEQEEKIRKALIPQPSQEVLVEGFGQQITRRDVQTLRGLNWLNDEVINFYMNLIMERSKLNKSLPKVYAFNTFFFPKLACSDYPSLRRWTKKVDIFSFDLILVPIHLGMHWCLSVIDFRSKSIQYYDSIGSPNKACLEKLMMYLRAESLDKKKKHLPLKDWKQSHVEDIPQQMNGSDCGVFSCMFAEYLARDCPILFTQDDMPYFRKKIVLEILEKQLIT